MQEGTGNTVHDERAGGLRAARLGTVEPVPDALDLAATESAITAIFKTGTTVHDEGAGGLWAARLGTAGPVPDGVHLMRGTQRFAKRESGRGASARSRMTRRFQATRASGKRLDMAALN